MIAVLESTCRTTLLRSIVLAMVTAVIWKAAMVQTVNSLTGGLAPVAATHSSTARASVRVVMQVKVVSSQTWSLATVMVLPMQMARVAANRRSMEPIASILTSTPAQARALRMLMVLASAILPQTDRIVNSPICIHAAVMAMLCSMEHASASTPLVRAVCTLMHSIVSMAVLLCALAIIQRATDLHVIASPVSTELVVSTLTQ